MKLMLDVIKKRRSIRIYQSKEVEEEKIQEILKAAMFAPSAKHCRSWEFIVIKDKKTINKLSQVKAGASFAKDAPIVLVLCADENLDSLWIEDLSIAAAHIYLEATNQGLGTCYVQINGRSTPDGDDTEDYIRKIIKAPANIRILCLMPIGYPAEKPGEHQDSEFDPKKIHQEKW